MSPIKILFGSQSGTAKLYAERLVYFFRRRHALEAQLIDLGEIVSLNELVELCESENNSKYEENVLIFVVSTYGFGGPTDNAKKFYDCLHDLPSNPVNTGKDNSCLLNNAYYAVLGLGDSCYENFAAMADFTDEKIGNIGAKTIMKVAKIDADDIPAVREVIFTSWRKKLIKILHNVLCFPEHDVLPSDNSHIPYEIVYECSKTNDWIDSKQSSLLHHRHLCPNTIELVCTIPAQTSFYPGFSAKILPENNLQTVKKVAKNLGLNLAQQIRFQERRNEKTISMRSKLKDQHVSPLFSTPCTIETALLRYCDLNAKPNADFLEEILYYVKPDSGSDSVDSGMSDFATIGEALYSIRRLVFPNLSILFYLIPRILPRYYTIASSPLAGMSEVRLCIKLARNISNDLNGNPVNGLATGYFLSLCEKVSNGQKATLDLTVVPSPFADFVESMNKSPIIMIAGGSGIAPIRGIIEHRHLLGIKRPPILIFLGFRSQEYFLYKDELTPTMLSEQNIIVFTAFSKGEFKGSSVKQYVQHIIEEQADTIRHHLGDSGRPKIGVCGSSVLCKEVKDALKRVLGTEKIKSMTKDLRYITEMF